MFFQKLEQSVSHLSINIKNPPGTNPLFDYTIKEGL